MDVGLTIVICTHNGKNRLGLVLEHINRLHIPDNFFWEVLIVDNASTDDTSAWVSNSNSVYEWNFQIYLVQEPKPGLNIARLTGARCANYDWLLFCDDDNLLDSNYVQIWFEVITTFHNLGAVGGRGIAVVDVTIPNWFNNYAHSYAVGPQFETTGFVAQGSALYGAGLFVLKTSVLNIVEAGFKMVMSDRESGKLTSGGDLEWCYLLQLVGLQLYYDDRLIFQHKIDSSRLTWNYYKKLKAGIASGVGLLEPYHYIFKNDYKNSFSFLIFYVSNLLKSLLVYAIVSLKSKLSSKYITDLGLIILKSKAESYYVNLSRAYNHYKQLKKTFGATV